MSKQEATATEQQENITMNTLLTIFFRIGGASFNVLKECGVFTCIKYFCFAVSVIVAVGLAFIGGFDIALQFTNSIAACIGVGLFWATLIFSFDFLVVNVGGLHGKDASWGQYIGDLTLKTVRGLAGVANVCITITALLIFLNQQKIENQIKLDNSEAIKAVDKEYLGEKEKRYALMTDKKKAAEKYNDEVVLVEARRGYPGPRYQEKLAAYELMTDIISKEIAKLDKQEEPYLAAYQQKRNVIVEQGFNDFFIKVEMLPNVVAKGGWLAIAMVICLFIFLASVELGALILKSTISDDDGYHIAEREYDLRNKPFQLEAAQAEASLRHGKTMLVSQKRKGDIDAQKHVIDMQNLDDSIVKEAEIRGKIRILRNKGYHASADALDAELGRIFSGQNPS